MLIEEFKNKNEKLKVTKNTQFYLPDWLWIKNCFWFGFLIFFFCFGIFCSVFFEFYQLVYRGYSRFMCFVFVIGFGLAWIKINGFALSLYLGWNERKICTVTAGTQYVCLHEDRVLEERNYIKATLKIWRW